LIDECNIYSNVKHKQGHTLAALAKQAFCVLRTQTFTRSFPHLVLI